MLKFVLLAAALAVLTSFLAFFHFVEKHLSKNFPNTSFFVSFFFFTAVFGCAFLTSTGYGKIVYVKLAKASLLFYSFVGRFLARVFANRAPKDVAELYSLCEVPAETSYALNSSLELIPQVDSEGHLSAFVMLLPIMGFIAILTSKELKEGDVFVISLGSICGCLAGVILLILGLGEKPHWIILRFLMKKKLLLRLIFKLDETGAMLILVGALFALLLCGYSFLYKRKSSSFEKINAWLLLGLFFWIQLIASDNLSQSYVCVQCLSGISQVLAFHWIGKESCGIKFRPIELGLLIATWVCRLKLRSLDFEAIEVFAQMARLNSESSGNAVFDFVFVAAHLNLVPLFVQILSVIYVRLRGQQKDQGVTSFVEPVVVAAATLVILWRLLFLEEGFKTLYHFQWVNTR